MNWLVAPLRQGATGEGDTVGRAAPPLAIPARRSLEGGNHVYDGTLKSEGENLSLLVTKEQVDRSASYPEVKTIFKVTQHSKWRLEHPLHNKADPYYLLTRREQVTVFRLRTGHNRLSYHLYSKLRIVHTEQCPCGTGSHTTEHLLQSCLPLRTTNYSERESGQTTLP